LRTLAFIALFLTLGVCAALAAILKSPVPLNGWINNPEASLILAEGGNPSPVHLVRPQPAPLSAMALLGQKIFFDSSLSSSGKLSCSSCHQPQNFYGPPGDAPAQFGGPTLTAQGVRAVPTLMYLEFQPNFSIGPDPGGDAETPVALPQLAAKAATAVRAQKTAATTAASAANIVPVGGLFWDGRVNTLQQQAMGPLLSPFEMDGGSVARVAAKFQAAPYAKDFTALFGPAIFKQPGLAVSEAMFAVARYQFEAVDFHPYTSKYDAWLEGHARLSQAEMRGYALFNDPAKGDCGACHLDQPSATGQPPLFTDHQYEALGAPRNMALAVNRNPNYYDLGICGPYRTDVTTLTQYCGMFLTPTLRNAATRKVFFHNGVYHDLQHVLDFYNFRDTDPEKIYPTDAAGHVQKYNDLPPSDWANIDNADPPFGLHQGDKPPLTPREEDDIIAFLKTLTDGYTSVHEAPGT
jgi:cytochrome c peroxidase